ncbi:MAG: DUF6528 family protein [Tannerella sp.]|jgi:hypothetical protein|nr:DUF6528 family protein [Tannerella sp.]
MRQLFILFACVFLYSCSDRQASYEIIAGGDDRLLIIDEASSNGEDVKVVWSWKVSDAAAQLPEAYQRYMVPIDDNKPVDGNTKLLVTSSGGGVVLLDRETKKCLFYAHVPMAHSADLLPNGRIAVALSTHNKGNSIEIYDVNKPEQVLYRDSLYSGHGAVWMPARNRFYALGFNELREYSLKNWKTASPELSLDRKWTVPLEGGHDLSPVSDSELLVSAHQGVFVFDIPTETFTPFEPLHSVENVKSVSFVKESQRLFYTKAEESWWTFHVYTANPDKTLTVPDIKLYKARIIKK